VNLSTAANKARRLFFIRQFQSIGLSATLGRPGGSAINYVQVFQIDPQEFAAFHSIPEAASRFSLEPRKSIRHSGCNATVEAKT
jgi:hypothetical protein